MKSNYKRLGNYIQEVNIRNEALQDINLLGVSIRKIFIPSIANIIGTDMSTYKMIKRGQFAYGPVTSRNGDKISVALLDDIDEALISQAYTGFEIKDVNVLLPEYLMMWFRRPEFDRYARFMSHGSAREMFSWDDMCDVMLPIPSVDKQKEIIKEYHTIVHRIDLNIKTIQKNEDLLQNLYKQWFVEFEFPDKNGCPYKSSGGKMVFINALEREIPIDWHIDMLKNIVTVVDNRGKTPPVSDKETGYPLIEIASIRTAGRNIEFSNCEKYLDKDVYEKWFRSGHPQKKDILFSTVGSLAEIKIFWGTTGSIAQNIVAFRSNGDYGLYLYQLLLNSKKELVAFEIGSVQASIKVSQVVDYKVLLPEDKILNKYEQISGKLTEYINILSEQNYYLSRLLQVLLQRMVVE